MSLARKNRPYNPKARPIRSLCTGPASETGARRNTMTPRRTRGGFPIRILTGCPRMATLSGIARALQRFIEVIHN